MTRADVHTFTGVYALHALSDREAEEFERHKAACACCTQEVRELQETTARLALATSETPSAEFRTRVMAALPQIRQLAPLVPEGRRFFGLRPLRWRLLQRRMPQLVVAVCLVIALVTGGFAIDEQRQEQRQRHATEQAQAEAAALNALLAAPDATFRSTAVQGGGSGTVVNSQALQRTAFVYQGLTELSADKVYELWYSRGGQYVPAGLLPVGAVDGTTVLTGTPRGAAGVGLTVEPAGGSARPTTTPVVLVGLPTT
ncbi:anti-sigma factor [Streptacidiphilus carbonis]|uniref:anti-sigma factor n=1 Tax=Streptacidiphilus carbonis TaxID=105422 RepID=UPI0005AA8C44|nr:anti-sigma factor [Streptacidiphilus carbonis]